jgi:hypothetical protein
MKSALTGAFCISEFVPPGGLPSFRHTGNRLKQRICHQLTGLLAVWPLSHWSGRHQGCEGRLYIILTLLLGAHECQSCTEQSSQINPLRLLYLLHLLPPQ